MVVYPEYYKNNYPTEPEPYPSSQHQQDYTNYYYSQGQNYDFRTPRTRLEKPEDYYNKFIQSDLTPNQAQYYKYNFSDVYQDFLTNWNKNRINQGLGESQPIYEDEYSNFLKGYNWTGNDKYRLFGQQPEQKYNFISPSLRWY